MGTLLFPLLWCELWYYVWPEVLVHPGATYNQVLCSHTFPVFFPAPPPRRPTDFEVDFEIQKTALTKRLNEEEADFLNFRAGSGRTPGVNSERKKKYNTTINDSWN